MPLLTTFLKSYSRPFLGISPPSIPKQISVSAEPGSLSNSQIKEIGENEHDPSPLSEDEELVEQDIRERFKRMCEGYFENVCKKLVIELKVRLLVVDFTRFWLTLYWKQRLQEQDKRNHEAYIRSGEIFEDRQQAYEKMTKGYEKLLASCQSLVCISHFLKLYLNP